jgi:hypothetical protein
MSKLALEASKILRHCGTSVLVQENQNTYCGISDHGAVGVALLVVLPDRRIDLRPGLGGLTVGCILLALSLPVSNLSGAVGASLGGHVRSGLSLLPLSHSD